MTGCTAADRSYWTVQSWQRALPDLGFTPWLPIQTVWQVHISHWTGDTASSTPHRLGLQRPLGGAVRAATYRGVPVHGFKSTHRGVTLDGYGRNLYLTPSTPSTPPAAPRERLPGAQPERELLLRLLPVPDRVLRHPIGSPSRRGPGVGVRYRINVIGPGVTPDVSAEIEGLTPTTRGTPPTSPTRRSRTHSVASSPSATSSAGTARPGRADPGHDAGIQAGGCASGRHRSRPGLSPGVVGPRRCAHERPAERDARRRLRAGDGHDRAAGLRPGVTGPRRRRCRRCRKHEHRRCRDQATKDNPARGSHDVLLSPHDRTDRAWFHPRNR